MDLLKISYIIGGYYDIILGLGILFLHKILFPLLIIPIPDEIIFLQVIALFLLAVGYYLLHTADKARDYIFIGLGSVFVRFVFAILVIFRLADMPFGLKLLAITDTLTGLLIVYAILKSK